MQWLELSLSEASSFLWVFCVGVGTKDVSHPPLTAFPGGKQEAGSQMEQLGHELVLMWDAGLADGD